MPHAADMWALSPAIKGPETKSSIITVKNDKISCAIEKKKKEIWFAELWQNEVATHHSERRLQTISEKIVQLNKEVIKGRIKELVRGSVEETLNELLEQEAEKLTQAARYERNEARQGYRSGHYDRNLTTTSGDITLHVPRLKGVSFEAAIIERYRRRESSVEKALIEMYLPVSLCAGWRVLPKLCGAARYLRQRLVS